MMASISWSSSLNIFTRDGSLWDVYVHRTSLSDWDATIEEIKSQGLRTKYSVSDDEEPLVRANAIFSMDPERLPMLEVWIGAVRLISYFVREDEIVYSVYPPEISDQQSLDNLLSFVRLLGNATRKRVGVAPDSLHQYPFITLEPGSNFFSIGREPSTMD